MRGAPRGELGAGLKDRIGGRLRHQALTHGEAVLSAEQQGQRGGSDRVLGNIFLNPVERRVTLVDDHIAQVEPAAVDIATTHANDDEGQASQAIPRHVFGSGRPFFDDDHHGAAALGADVAAELGEQCVGAEEFDDRETLPCRQWTTAGWSAGQRAGRWH